MSCQTTLCDYIFAAEASWGQGEDDDAVVSRWWTGRLKGGSWEGTGATICGVLEDAPPEWVQSSMLRVTVTNRSLQTVLLYEGMLDLRQDQDPALHFFDSHSLPNGEGAKLARTWRDTAHGCHAATMAPVLHTEGRRVSIAFEKYFILQVEDQQAVSYRESDMNANEVLQYLEYYVPWQTDSPSVGQA